MKLLYRAGARDAVSLFFPELATRIDWSKLTWIEKEVALPGPPPRSIVADLVGRTQDVEGRYLEVLIHPEIQMEPAVDIGWRVFQYNAGLTLQQANPDARVLTFVFYHCRGAGGIQEQHHRLDFYGHTIHFVGYWSVGLGDLTAEEYAEADNPMAWALTAWMRQRREGRAELRVRLLARILRFVRDDAYRRLLLDAVRTYFQLNPNEQAEEQRLLRSGEYGEIGEMIHTELGRLEDRVRRETLRDALLDIVQTRFPAASESLTAHVRRQRSSTRLKELIRRVAAADSLDEVEALLRP